MANECDTAVSFVDAVLGEVAAYSFASVTFFAVVDRASTDGTRQVLDDAARQRPALHVVWSPENEGVADAYIRGYREALDAGCDWVLEIDAGFSHQPTEIPQFLDRAVDGFDCVFGSRNLAGGQNLGSWDRRFVSRAGTVAARALLGTKLTDMTSGFQLFRRDVLQKILETGIRSKGPFFQTEMKSYCRGLNVAEVPIEYRGGTAPVGRAAILESVRNLMRLIRMRVRGEF